MKHDIFDFHGEMTPAERRPRLIFLAIIIAITLMDLLVWRPQ